MQVIIMVFTITTLIFLCGKEAITNLHDKKQFTQYLLIKPYAKGGKK
jgi:hypothetical protein